MSWVYGHYIFCYSFQCGDSLQTSESDVCLRQILKSKDGPRSERVNLVKFCVLESGIFQLHLYILLVMDGILWIIQSAFFLKASCIRVSPGLRNEF